MNNSKKYEMTSSAISFEKWNKKRDRKLKGLIYDYQKLWY